MRAVLLKRQQPVTQSPLALLEVDEPQPAADEVRLKVSVCAVCRTDIHIVEGDLALHRSPIVPGHQVVGRIDQVGAKVTRLRVGQRIGIAWLRYVDGTCRFCRRGRENLCLASRYTGYDVDGGCPNQNEDITADDGHSHPKRHRQMRGQRLRKD